MAAHEYWRVYIDANNGSTDWTHVVEVEMRATVGGADQCSGGTAIGPAFSLDPTQNAFDDSVDSKWASPTGEATDTWVGYQFPAPIILGEIVMVAVPYGTAPGGYPYAPKDFRVQYSDNGLDWVDHLAVTGQTGWGAAEMRSFIAVTPIEISGTVLLDGAAYPAKVRAYRAADGALVGQTTSDAVTGSYTVTGTDLVAGDEYYVMVINDAGGRSLVHGPVQG